MIVEDDPTIRDGLSQLLQLEGFRASRAENGRDSLNQLKAGARPDVIVLDLEMPVMDGWTFLRELDASLRSGTPVVVVTSAARVDDLAAQAGCDVFDKASHLDLILDRIRVHCGH